MNKINLLSLCIILLVGTIKILVSILNVIYCRNDDVNSDMYNIVILSIFSIYTLVLLSYTIIGSIYNYKMIGITFLTIMGCYDIINAFIVLSFCIYYDWINPYLVTSFLLTIISIIIFVSLYIYNRNHCKKYYYTVI